MINYREIIKDEEIKLRNLYLETKNIIYLHYFEEILYLEVMLGIIDPDERINIYWIFY